MNSAFERAPQFYVRLGGEFYLINSLPLLLAPALASLLFPWVLLPVLAAELIKPVDDY